MFSTVLFPVDQSRESREAAEMVANFVKENHSDRLVLLSVIEDSVSEDTEGDRDGQIQANGHPNGHPNGHAEVMSSPEAIAELLANAKQLFEAKGIHAEVQERQGKPAFAICDLADEISADLIIMGCRGMSLVGDGASESVTQRVINLSPCPVLVVP
ncbi:MAG: universal stress protein [Synechococcales cyanobacterium RU_4_20]|nr:universal stress protein [Synechococcales cyanobacterium RU_4_20]NJR70720.1 universal stress protein [Synechococcales cyanobacterium CRU_2_2]